MAQPKCLLAVLAITTALLSAAEKRTALDRYVAAPDPNYKYELISTIKGEGFTTFVLDMTSQSWRSAAEVDRPLWKHWVTITRPDKVKSDIGFLFITGGSNTSKPPSAPDPMLRGLAVDTQTIVAELRMVPNQPLTFAGETKGRTEDALIAYTWDKYLRGGDEFWPARLPMTKSAVRAMDTVTAFAGSDAGGGVKISRFVVSGASKRGWTTWTTAAVDTRVVAIVPLVIDLLNVIPSFEHHWQVYGFWAPAIRDYVDMEITDWSRTPQYKALMEIEEPYEYRDRLTMPKMIINASGDQFFLPDSSQFYFDDLKGEKHLRYVPNADHSLRKSDAADTLHAFYQSIVNGAKRPDFSWKFDKDGSIKVKTSDKPSAVKLWQALNSEKRDFRLETIGPNWRESALEETATGQYTARIDSPPKGWAAFFVELTYPSGGKHPFKFTTGVRVLPDRKPFPPFEPARP
jgi:PhoPQ-activated pathogenicity-related protein